MTSLHTCSNESGPMPNVSDGSHSTDHLNLVDHLVNNMLVVVALFALDLAVIKPFVSGRCQNAKDEGPARWFLIHSIANAFVVLTSLTSVHAVLVDPIHAVDPRWHSDLSLFGDASPWPLTFINSVHVYHMIGGFRLSAADYFHHLVFIPTLGVPGQIFRWGALGNFQAFFISGLPGGIDYALLGFQKTGFLSNMTEKRVNANLNTWVRTPGIIVAVTFIYQAWLYDFFQAPLWALVLQLMLPGYNALYFGKQATANYAVHYMLNLLGQDELIKSRIEQRTSCTTGTEIMAWRDSLSVPQRGS